VITLVEGQQSRQIQAAEFPLAMGLTRIGSVVVGAAAEAAPVLWILIHKSGLSVQPEAARAPARRNGMPLTAPVWLRDGDEIALGASVITVRMQDGTWTLAVGSPAPAVEHSHADGTQAQRLGAKFTGAAAQPHQQKAVVAKRVALAVFAVLFLCVAYVLAASPLQVQITPEADSVAISGLLPVIPVGDRHLAFPGRYVLEARKAGYRPLQQAIVVPYGAAAAFDFSLQKLPGQLRVTTSPVEGATIFIDGVERGASPAAIAVDAGEHEVRVVTDRYLPETRRIAIEGMEQLQELAIALQPAWGTVAVSTAPDNAIVRLDGAEIGETPLTFEALQGPHEIEFVKEGWKAATRKIDVQAATHATIPPVDLEKIDGVLDLRSSPAAASVLVDGEFRGTTPTSLRLVGDKEYQLTLSKAGYESQKRNVRVEPGKQAPLTVSLEPELGTVFITTMPPGAALIINGRASGSATQRLTLQTIPQSVEIRKEGYEPYRTVLTPQRGVPKRLDVTLKTAGEALKERAKSLVSPGGQRLVLIYMEAPLRFTAGSPRRDPARRSNEVEYPVELRRPFLISEKEVTNAEFRKFRPSHTSGSYQGISLDGPDQPVVNVSWEDAARYANWLSAREGLAPAYKEEGGKVVPVIPLTNGYRLPTEAEWEFVARYDGGRRPASNPLHFAWGDSLPPPKESGNFAHEGSGLPFAIPGYVDAYVASAPVGKFAPNQSQVYDLGGNVAEWCHDFYDVPSAARSEPLVDPAGPHQGRFHVVKGPSWRSGSAIELRLSYRDYAEKPRDDLGFRIVRYVDTKP
jgi:formylglycine-generating enzyme required for sulfatase activity